MNALDSTVAATDASGETAEQNSEAGGGSDFNQWERYCHKVLLSQHSNFFRELLRRAWNELETKSIADMAVIEEEFFKAS